MVAPHPHRSVGQLCQPLVVGADTAASLTASKTTSVRSHLSGVEVLAFIEPRQQQQVGHQRIHPVRFGFDAGQRVLGGLGKHRGCPGG